MNKYCILLMGLLLSLLSCNGGSSTSTSGASSNTTSKQYILGNTQIRTPSSALTLVSGLSNFNINSLKKNLSPLMDDNCMVLLTQTGGKNYTTTINSSTWWSTAKIEFQIQNSCTTPIMVNTTAIVANLKMNNVIVTNSSIAIAQSGSPYLSIADVNNGVDVDLNINSPSCQGDWCSWAQASANAIFTIDLNLSSGGPINSLTMDSITIQGINPPPPPPPTVGELDVTVNATQLQNLCSSMTCDLQINLTSPSSAPVGSTIHVNPQTQTTVITKYNNLLVGSYTVSVIPSSIPTVSNGSINYNIQPASQIMVSANNVATANVNFNYTKPVAQGSLQIKLANITNATTFSNIGLINGIISDQTTATNYPFQIGLDSQITVNNLPADDDYNVHLQGIADPLSGIYYQVADIKNIVLTSSQVTIVDLVESQIISGLSSVRFTVESAASNQTIAFGSDNQLFKYNVDNLHSAVYTFANADTVAATINTANGATVTTTPAPLVITGGSPSIVSMVFTNSNNKRMVTGYIDGTATGAAAAITNAAFKQYNNFIIGFSNCNAQNVSCAPNTDDGLLPIMQRVSQYANPSSILLLSVGGENGSFSFATPADMTALANALIADINNLNSQITAAVKISGIDLDIEANNSGGNITALAQALHQKGLVVSIAPQASTNQIGTTDPMHPANVDPINPTNFILTASGTSNSDYSAAVAGGYVDQINLQAYNSGSGVIQINSTDETMPSFHQNMAQVMNQLVSANCGILNTTTNYYANGDQVCIPQGTKIFIGTVANKSAGGAATMWASEIPTTSGNVQILAQFTSSVKAAMAYSNYSGVMVWAIGNDFFPSAWGGDTWDPVGAFTQNIINFGF